VTRNYKSVFDDLSELRVCIIDDEPEVIHTVERILKAHGYHTLGISEVIGSSGKVNRFKPHILIMDIKMPALDGRKLLETFRRTLMQMPKVIFFSGIEPGELEEIAINAGADDFLYKGDGYLRLPGRISLLAYEMKMCESLPS
jgi:DNA-binding response OmpR family regulator